MNCFEARQEFPALWRSTLTVERRGELLAHLKGCDKCDHAYRVFALTAPVLHGEMEQPSGQGPAAAMPGVPAPPQATGAPASPAVPAPGGYREGQTASGPNGARMVFRGGQWTDLK